MTTHPNRAPAHRSPRLILAFLFPMISARDREFYRIAMTLYKQNRFRMLARTRLGWKAQWLCLAIGRGLLAWRRCLIVKRRLFAIQAAARTIRRILLHPAFLACRRRKSRRVARRPCQVG